MGAGAGGQGAATGGLQGMGVKLLTSQAGVCCPRFLADFLLLAVLLLRTLKVDTVEHLVGERQDPMRDGQHLTLELPRVRILFCPAPGGPKGVRQVFAMSPTLAAARSCKHISIKIKIKRTLKFIWNHKDLE